MRGFHTDILYMAVRRLTRGKISSKIKHRVLNIRSGWPPSPTCLCIVKYCIFVLSSSGACIIIRRKSIVQVTPSPFAGDVGVISWRDKWNTFSGSGKHITCIVSKLLNLIGAKLVLVDNLGKGHHCARLQAALNTYDNIMRRPNRTCECLI